MIIKENMQINVSGDSLTTNNEIFDDLVSESEAVQLLKVSQMTLLRWRNAGILGFYRPGGHRVMYSKSKHLLPFLKSCEQSTKAA